MIYLQELATKLSSYYKLHQNPVGVKVSSKFPELPILWFWFKNILMVFLILILFQVP
jgi:hypothetical protein